ncbi:MAG: FKBP-type peptidyl-prolyl cis-trans isomerase [Arcticibacterium sp.]|jgi:FKBP-type peptidyl-prolyl cis-trans isomerase
MKRLIAVIPFIIVLTSCSKGFVENEDNKKYNENVAEIKAYNESNNLGLTESQSTGIFWKKTEEVASPKYATQDLALHVAFSLKTLDGQIIFQQTVSDSSFFDASIAASVYTGFLFAVSTLGEGEKGVYYLPASAAYGASPPSGTPLMAYQVTVLEMEMVKHYNEFGLIDLFIKRNGLRDPEITDIGVRIIRTENRPATGGLLPGDQVKVKYKGYFLDKKVFDEGEILVTLGAKGVIEGFEDGVANMRIGEQSTIIIPWAKAYGAAGNSGVPPYSTLVFDLEILSKEN